MERLTISLDESLAEAFDVWLGQHGYANRSEAFRDLIRSTLGAEQQQRQPGGLCAASLSYVYNHHERGLGARLMALQHAAHDLVVSSTWTTTIASRPCCSGVWLRRCANWRRLCAPRRGFTMDSSTSFPWSRTTATGTAPVHRGIPI